MTRNAATVPAGSDGLIMLPFFTGERAPNWNADARGVLFGLTLGHTMSHMIRATLEGVCYRMNSVMLALGDVAGPAHEIRVSGAFTRSELWVQVLADVFDHEINATNVEEGAAFGAAVLGFVSAGVIDDVSATAGFVSVKKTYRPRPAEAEVYRTLFGDLQSDLLELAQGIFGHRGVPERMKSRHPRPCAFEGGSRMEKAPLFLACAEKEGTTVGAMSRATADDRLELVALKSNPLRRHCGRREAIQT